MQWRNACELFCNRVLYCFRVPCFIVVIITLPSHSHSAKTMQSNIVCIYVKYIVREMQIGIVRI